MDYGGAVFAAQDGYRIRRLEWNDESSAVLYKGRLMLMKAG